MIDKYTILMTIFTQGQACLVVGKDEVRDTCERLRNTHAITDYNTYMRIEVVNNETGEIREYWNNHENKINF